ncbi:thiamine pyrophosphate-binding protein [Allopusillimonas ginsengisoli]|uniref:thiamine pyrophosphate-binding protein n=1 Tax=Allopusillimonas ginsengisoli TaxID=453575 RepID=UPI001021FA6B|nr:thiamine pyrophosphate-binding protein [Allopusillimonas ginsengisoli]TEA77893.1 thiamine pyrophosphate-binding protein [Allopusillimonas ginsengisoli]
MSGPMRGSDMLVSSMRQAGIHTLFSLSGNHIMPIYDALLGQNIRLVHARHEGAAVHMADAWARLKGEVGVALVTGGPGHANAVSALYTALMSESPVILLSGHAPLSRRGYGAFQEMDQVAMALPAVKAAWVCGSADELAHDFAKACQIALSGRPGPVHLSLPTDVLEALANNQQLPAADRYQAVAQALPDTAALEMLTQLRQAERPMVVLGPQGLTDAGRAAVASLQAALGIPVVATESPRGGNDPSLGAWASALSQADCILLVGKKLDFTLGFGQAPVVAPECIFLQVDADEAEFARSVQAVGKRLQLRHQADVPAALQTFTRLAAGQQSDAHRAWQKQVASDLAYRPFGWHEAAPDPSGSVHPAQVCRCVQDVLNRHKDAVLVVDGGEFGQWAQACLTAPHRIINGAAGAIGAALPMAVAAKLAYPEAPVVALMGDGTFGFHCAELDTALRNQAPILCVVGNDARWNAEYQIQVRDYGADRTIGCELLPSRYDKVAAAFGGHGEWVASLQALPVALDDAAASGLPACINVMLAGLPAPVMRRA